MNPFIRPIFHLMNQLNYRSKFILLASLFAIPLVFLAGQLAYSFHQEANQAKLTKTGLLYFQEVTELIEDLEVLRDISVILSWQSGTQLKSQFNNTKKSAILKISKLKMHPASSKHLAFLSLLQNTIRKDHFIRGNESEGIDGIFDNAHRLVSKVYSWRSRISYTFVSRTRNSADIIDTINLLNESENYLHPLGQARAFGTLYLEQKFIDSYGISVLEKTYQTLSKLVNLIEVKSEEYKELISHQPQIKTHLIKQGVTEAQELLYQQLIESLSLTGDPIKFYTRISEIFERVYHHNDILFELSNSLLEADFQENKRRLTIFYTSVVFLVMLIAYIYIGLYSTMNLAVRSLMSAAHKVASGNYDSPIETHTKDELASVAKAMNSMRLSIQEREEKLTYLGQRDGLTKLYNRQYFDTALESSLANTRRHHTPLTILMLDIDHFKKVNDTYGHQAGDNCLSIIAELLQEQFKRETDIVARYGGEEFIAILYGTSLKEAEVQAEQLRNNIEFHHIQVGDNTISLTASFGLAGLTSPFVVSSEALITLADNLLYHSKNNGRNRISSAYFSGDNTNEIRA